MLVLLTLALLNLCVAGFIAWQIHSVQTSLDRINRMICALREVGEVCLQGRKGER